MTPPARSGRKDLLLPAIINLTAVTVHHAVPWLLILATLLVLRSIVYRLTSSDTVSGIWIELMANVGRTRAFAFVFGFFGILYGLQQRNLRRTTEGRLSRRIAALESMIEGRRERS